LRIRRRERVLHKAVARNHGGKDPSIAPGFTLVFDRPSCWYHTRNRGYDQSGHACYPRIGKGPNELVHNPKLRSRATKSSGEQYPPSHRIEISDSRGARGLSTGWAPHSMWSHSSSRYAEAHAAHRLHCGIESLISAADRGKRTDRAGSIRPLIESAGLRRQSCLAAADSRQP